ncbi:MAG: hypothetical protein JXA03_10130 [Bacteroidales bacterium]|nr:hypothetical protein [Bacteroidales bacterium]
MIYILTGDIGSGKTTTASGVYELLKNQGCRPGGIISPGFMKNGVKSEYHVRDLMTGTECLLCSGKENPDWIQLHSFWFDPASIDFGNQALLRAAAVCDTALIIDEIGPLEMAGSGWHKSLLQLTGFWTKPMVCTVRTSLAGIIPTFYGWENCRIINIMNINIEDISRQIRENVSSKGD